MTNMKPPARHPDYPPRIVDIAEDDFWSRLRVRQDNPHGTLLRRAIRYGRDGAGSQAYSALADYHNRSLRNEYAFYRDGGLPINYHAPKQTVADLMRHRIWVSRSVPLDYGHVPDWSFVESCERLFSFYWFLPLVDVLYRDPSPEHQSAARSIVWHYYRARNRYPWPGPGYHPVYTALSGSISCRHLLPAYVALAVQNALTPETTEAFLKLFLGIARALHRRETTLVMNNQTVTNCQATALVVAAFPEFREAEAMRRRTIDRMMQHFQRGFLADGSYYERSFDYSRVTLHDALSLYHAAQRVQPVAPVVTRTTRRIARRALGYFEKALGPGGVGPAIGDSRLETFTPLLAELRGFLGLTESRGGHRSAVSHCCRPAGFAFLRNGAHDKNAWLTFNFGRSDLWHSHRDVLNLNFWAYGEPLIEEVGRFDSYANPLDRLFRSPQSHNVPVVDGMHYDERYPELWRGETVQWKGSAAADYVGARHRVYRRQPTSVAASADWVTCRSVVFVKDPGYAIVFDAFYSEHRGAARIAVSQYWHALQPFRRGRNHDAIVRGQRGRMLVQAVRLDHLRRMETAVDVAADEAMERTGSYALDRYSLRLRAWGSTLHAGAIGFVTLLFPFCGERPDVTAQCIPVTGGSAYLTEAVSVRIGQRTDIVAVNPLRLNNVGVDRWPLKESCVVRIGD